LVLQRSVAGAELCSAKIEMYFLRCTSQNEDQQHERRNCESEVCRAMALVHLQETGSATCSRAVHMGRSIPMAIKPKIGDTSPFFAEQNLRFRTSYLPASPDNENIMDVTAFFL